MSFLDRVAGGLKKAFNKVVNRVQGRRTVYEVVVYGLVIDEGTRKYAFADITFYTKNKIDYHEVFEVVESLGYRIVRDNRDSLDRVSVAGRRLTGKIQTVDDWREFLLDKLNGLDLAQPNKSHKKKYGNKGKSSKEYLSEQERMDRAFFEK